MLLLFATKRAAGVCIPCIERNIYICGGGCHWHGEHRRGAALLADALLFGAAGGPYVLRPTGVTAGGGRTQNSMRPAAGRRYCWRTQNFLRPISALLLAVTTPSCDQPALLLAVTTPSCDRPALLLAGPELLAEGTTHAPLRCRQYFEGKAPSPSFLRPPSPPSHTPSIPPLASPLASRTPSPAALASGVCR